MTSAIYTQFLGRSSGKFGSADILIGGSPASVLALFI